MQKSSRKCRVFTKAKPQCFFILHEVYIVRRKAVQQSRSDVERKVELNVAIFTRAGRWYVNTQLSAQGKRTVPNFMGRA